YTNFNLTSDVIDASLTGNAKITDLKTAFNNHLNNYIAVPDSLLGEKEYHFDFDLALTKPDFFTDFLIDGLDGIIINHCHASYDGANDLFEADIRIPQLNYANWKLDSLSFLLSSEGNSILSKLELAQFSYDSIYIKNIAFSTKFAEQNATISLTINDIRDSLKYQIETNVAFKDSSYVINLNPEKFTIDYQPWFVDKNNNVIIKNRDVTVRSVSLTNDNQRIWLESIDDHIKLNFEQFDIQNIMGIVEKEKAHQILNGSLDGYIDVVDLFGETSIKSDLRINDLNFKETRLGNLKALIDFKTQDAISYSLNLTNNLNSIKLNGRYEFNSDHTGIEAAFVTDISEADVFSGLLEEYLTGLNGGINGRIEIIGDVANPRLNGQMNFSNLSMTIGSLNTLLTSNGSISLKDNLVEFKNFTVS
ncbi:MAG: hypothetical protein KAI99_16735, partial [Cyclobacteriaceae bacterium]|nr:hypothetical protein [Cyclobacteriaceae bacterium]